MKKERNLKILYKTKGGRTTPLIYPALVTPHTRVQGSWMPLFPPLLFLNKDYNTIMKTFKELLFLSEKRTRVSQKVIVRELYRNLYKEQRWH